MLPHITPLRLTRLCLKELRESLRDRRTIVTLVLMPLLVYPLLSLVLHRVLLNSFTGQSEEVVTFGIGSELKSSQLPGVLQIGYILLRDPDAAPVFLDGVVEDGKPRTNTGDPADALPTPQLVPLSDDGRMALRNDSVDIVITRKTVDRSPEAESLQIREQAVDSMVELYANLEVLNNEFVPENVKELIGHLEVRYRKGDWRSERALQVLERILAAVNNEASRELIGKRYEAPFRLLATPVVMKSDYADLLATMVPLVLVLMTMAGAVYPAIDLTAGERERGTMEALIVSPTPSYALLLAKYSAVVTVALLTAIANLTAMSVTLKVSGIGDLIFGETNLSVGVVGTILVLLVLFTMFFAALLLAVTSFAKSFKEAQAYLIPLMLLALTPGVTSLLPGIKFTNLLATVPLVNIVLLAREVLIGNAVWNTALVAVICNAVYALAALAIASRLFGSDASMHGSKGSWRDLLMPPEEGRRTPTVDQMALTMALMFPLYFIASNLLTEAESDIGDKLWMSSLVSYLLILGMPLAVCLFRRIQFNTTFRLSAGSPQNWMIWLPAALLVGSSAWMIAHEIFILGQHLGIGTITDGRLEQVAESSRQLHQQPLLLVLFALAITPAVCEEFLFRGFVLSSLKKYSAAWAVAISAMVFGLMHVLTSNVLIVERFLPTTFMGLILGIVALRTGSIWPGMLLHALHNGLLLTLGHYSEELKEMNFLMDEQEHLPAVWLICGSLAILLGMSLIWFSHRSPNAPEIDEETNSALPAQPSS